MTETTREGGPFSGSFDELRRRTAEAAADPKVGMGFHEMYSYWVFVTAVTDGTVQVVRGGGHPSHFPECGQAQVVSRTEFPKYVRYVDIADREYSVAGWAERAEGITVEELERRIRATGRRDGVPS